MSFTLEASLLLAATIGVLLLAHWLLLGRHHKAPVPPGENDGPRQASPRRGLTGPASGRRGPSTPLLCKRCGAPWAGGLELLCAAYEEQRLDLLDEFSRGQMDGIW